MYRLTKADVHFKRIVSFRMEVIESVRSVEFTGQDAQSGPECSWSLSDVLVMNAS